MVGSLSYWYETGGLCVCVCERERERERRERERGERVNKISSVSYLPH